MKAKKIGFIVGATVMVLVVLGVWVSGTLGSIGQPVPTAESASQNDQTSSADAVLSSDNKEPLSAEEESMAGWLEDKLLPGNEFDKGENEILTWEGWMFDRDCIGINPVKHTKACSLMGTCFDSGLGIIPYVPGKSFDTYVALDTFLVFDGNSSIVAQAFLRSLPEDWKNNITIKITGYAVNNIPTNADETFVPETDTSKIDHYLSGIHITSIEAAYLEGLSTNTLPSPNLIIPKP
ncbi:MAG: hypothetical protein ACOH15_08215 [Acetobacterium sp.]